MRAGLVLLGMSTLVHAQPAPSTPPTTPPAGSPTGTAPASGPPGSEPPTVLSTGGPPEGTPLPPPVVGTAGTPPVSNVMKRRWAVALGIGAASFKPSQPDGASTTGFATFELAGRFRIRPAIELALALGGGTSYDNNYTASRIVLDFRYRFMAERPFNIYALGGIGVGSVTGKDPTDKEKKGRGALRIGGGGELRFDNLAVSAELRINAIGENKEVPDPIMTSTRYQLERFGTSGFELLLGATYYF